jgi:exo-beta-1,3-glucanase (GH17 family)
MSSPADILADALLIRRHFRQVRTFYSAYYQTPVMPYFVQAGLKAVLGVFMYPDEPSWTEAEKRVAVQSAISFPSHTVAIYVGNENVAPYGNYSVDELIRHMQDVREGLREKGVQVPVGTVQRLTEWLREKDEMDRLAEASDLLGVNFYPYFSIDGESLEAQWEKMVKRYPNHMQKIRVTETGWPSAGNERVRRCEPRVSFVSFQHIVMIYWATGALQGSYSRMLITFFF